MTIIGDVLPALGFSALASAGAAGAAGGAGAGAAFGAGLTAAQMASLGFSAGVVGAGGVTAGTAAAGAGAGILGGLTAKEAILGLTATGSLLSGTKSILDGGNLNDRAKDELRALQAADKPDAAGEAHKKRLKEMVANRKKLKTTSGSGGLLSTNSKDQKLGNS